MLNAGASQPGSFYVNALSAGSSLPQAVVIPVVGRWVAGGSLLKAVVTPVATREAQEHVTQTLLICV